MNKVTIKYDNNIIKQAKRLFPTDANIHKMISTGDRRLLDIVKLKIGFIVDEDDILRAFRNKKEDVLLRSAQRAKDIRDFYNQVYIEIDKQENKFIKLNNLKDCF
jgi:hypothetical protein